MIPTENPYTKQVNKGAALLDKFHPGWYREINVSKLEMSSCTSCVLGQLFKDFWDGVERLDASYSIGPEFSFNENDFGFNAIRANYDQLRNLWIKEITRRLNSETAL